MDGAVTKELQVNVDSAVVYWDNSLFKTNFAASTGGLV